MESLRKRVPFKVETEDAEEDSRVLDEQGKILYPP